MSDPATYWVLGYFLFVLLFLTGFWKGYGCPPWELPFELWAASLLWPLSVAFALGLLVVLGTHVLGKKAIKK